MIAVKIAIALCSIVALAECSFLAQFARRDEPIEQGPDGDSCHRVVERCDRQTFSSQEYPFKHGATASKPLKDIYGEPGYAQNVCSDVNTFVDCLREEGQKQICTGSAIEDTLELAEALSNYVCGLRFQRLLPLASRSPCLAEARFPDNLTVEHQMCFLNKTTEVQRQNICQRFEVGTQCLLSTVRRNCGVKLQTQWEQTTTRLHNVSQGRTIEILSLTLLMSDVILLAQSHKDFEDCEFSQEQEPAQAVKRAVSDFMNMRK